MSAIERGEHDPGVPSARPEGEPSWTFLTNHAHVLICLSADPDLRLRDIAGLVGITERAAQRIVADLVAGGYVERSRTGRRNAYRLRLERPMRHPVEAERPIGALVATFAGHPD